MADFTALKTAIQNAIKQNGNEEITGAILQEVLLAVVSTLGDSAITDLVTALGNEVTARQNADSALGTRIDDEESARQNAINTINTKLAEGYLYVGIATTSTNPSTPSGKVFYIAVAAGTYTNFLNSSSQPLVLTQGINILKYNGTSWSVEQVWGVDDEPTAESNNLVKSGGVFDKVMTDGSAFDISAHFASGGSLATYADLNAALTALNTLSASYKRGGMSIKFVQSSDNKYVQYRLMADNWSIDEEDWQGIYGFIISNAEYILGFVDINNKILFGLRNNGDVYWEAGVPKVIKEFVRSYTDRKYEILYSTVNTLFNALETELNTKIEKRGVIISNDEFKWGVASNDNKILLGVRNDGDVYWEAGVPKVIKEFVANFVDVIIKENNSIIMEQARTYCDTAINNGINSIKHNFAVIPNIGSGRMIISDEDEKYCHNPRLVAFRGGMSFVLYQACNDGRASEDFSANTDYFKLVKFSMVNPKNRYVIIVASDTDPYKYNGNNIDHIYNQSMWLDSINQVLHIKYNAICNGVRMWFHQQLSVWGTPTVSSPVPLKLSYNGNEVDFTLPNYIAMINSLYGSSIPSDNLGEGSGMDITEVVQYNSKYYMLATYTSDLSEVRPIVFMSSDDGIVWQPINNVLTAAISETSIAIKDDKVYALFRKADGTYYTNFNLDGTGNLGQIKISDSFSLPCIFEYAGLICGVYNVPYALFNNSYRNRLAFSVFNNDGTYTKKAEYFSGQSFTYPSVSRFSDTSILYMANAEHGEYRCDINYGMLNVDLQ